MYVISLHVSAQTAPDLRGKLEAYLDAGNGMLKTGRFKALTDTLGEALELPLQEYPDLEIRLRKLRAMGFFYSGDLISARAQLESGMARMNTPALEKQFGSSINMLGVICTVQGEHANALEHFNHYLRLLPEDDSMEVSSVLMNIAEVHQKLNELDQAERNLRKCLDLRRPMPDGPDRAIAFTQLGRLYRTKGQFNLAVSYLDTALAIQRATADTAGISISMLYLSGTYEEMGRFEKALDILKDRIALDAGPSKTYNRSQDCIVRARLHDTLRLDSVKYFLDQGLLHADSIDALDLKIKGLTLYTRVLEREGDYAGALARHKALFALYTELNDIASLDKLARERARFKTDQAEADVADLSEENENLEETNTRYWGWILLLAALLGLLLLLALLLRRAQARMRAQNEQLRSLIDAKNKFFGIIAHDLRNPLIAFQSIGKRIEKAHKSGQGEKVEQLAQMLDQNAVLLNGLLNNLLSWALLENGMIRHRPGTVHLDELCADNLDLFRDMAELKGISLHSEIPAGTTFEADEDGLNLMLRNLISNAVKFSPEGGEVRVSVERKKDRVLLRVEDSGPGIPPEKVAELFSIRSGTQTGTAGEKGTGLGLHLVAEHMALHEGRVYVEPREGGGSVFILEFPQ